MKKILYLLIVLVFVSCSSQVKVITSDKTQFIPGVANAEKYFIYEVKYTIKGGKEMDLERAYFLYQEKQYPVELQVHAFGSTTDSSKVNYQIECSSKQNNLPEFKGSEELILVFKSNEKESLVKISSFNEKTERRR